MYCYRWVGITSVRCDDDIHMLLEQITAARTKQPRRTRKYRHTGDGREKDRRRETWRERQEKKRKEIKEKSVPEMVIVSWVPSRLHCRFPTSAVVFLLLTIAVSRNSTAAVAPPPPVEQLIENNENHAIIQGLVGSIPSLPTNIFILFLHSSTTVS